MLYISVVVITEENDIRTIRGFARKFSDKTSKQFPIISVTSCIYAFYENGTKYVCLFMIKTGVMNFKTGQKVLCVNDYFGSYCAYPIRKGLIYTIHGFYKCDCGSDQITLKEIPGSIIMGCRCFRTSFRRQSYFTWRFMPLDYFEKFIDLSSDIKKILEELDVRIPEPHKVTSEERLRTIIIMIYLIQIMSK